MEEHRKNEPEWGTNKSNSGGSETSHKEIQKPGLKNYEFAQFQATTRAKSFTISETGNFSSSQKVGEDENETVKLIIDNNKPVSALNMIFDDPGRQTCTIELADPTDRSFAMEAWIDVAR